MPKALSYAIEPKGKSFANPIFADLYPLGWSRDGKFAYVKLPANEACCQRFDVYIQDMRTGKILWKWDFEDTEKKNISLAQVWKKNKALFTRQMNKYQVDPVAYSKLENFPLKTNEASYNFQLSNTSFFDSGFNMIMLKGSSIYEKINGKGQKKIYSKNYAEALSPEQPNTQFSMIISNKIRGYLLSPYENRIVILYSTEIRGYEGPPNMIDVELIGYGFK